MEENKTNQENVTEQPIEMSLLEQTKEQVDRLEAANKVQTELIAKQEALQAEKMLGGESEAGSQPEPKRKLSDKEYSQAVIRGEIDPFI